jgi:hypothetical protein
MKNIIKFFLLLLIVQTSFSQFDDILKKIPGVNDFLNKSALTTDIKDAYPYAVWMNEYEQYFKSPKKVNKLENISSGFSRVELKSFCLMAGGYAPYEGYGYLFAPFKGTKASLIKNILERYANYPDINQKSVQSLIWGIESGVKFTDFSAQLQAEVMPLLKPEDIALMEVNPYEAANLVLPDDVKQILNLYESIRSNIKSASSTYEDLERIAVRTGIPPSSKNLKKVDYGTWTLTKDGHYIRIFPNGYTKTSYEVYKPNIAEITKDSKGRITQVINGKYKTLVEYDDSKGSDEIKIGTKKKSIHRFKSVKFFENGIEIASINDKGWYSDPSYKSTGTSGYTGLNNPATEDYSTREKLVKKFSNDIKKYLKKRKIKSNSIVLKEIQSLKSFEKSMIEIAAQTAFNYENIYGFLWSIMDVTLYKVTETASKFSGKGGQSRTSFSLPGYIAVPGNTGLQRLGISGNETGEGIGEEGNEGEEGENEEEEEPPTIILRQVNRESLPSPNVMFTARLDIESEKPVEEIVFDLFGISSENGRCLNDKDPEFYKSAPDADMIFDPSANYGYEITSTGYGDWFVATGEGSAPRQIVVQAKDYGGFAKLKARVKIDGNWYNAQCEGWGNYYVKVPYDMNDNNIADKWEDDNTVSGLAPDWDEDGEPSGQATNGDGLTLYEEYRGIFQLMADLTVEHIRTNPKKKELFVIDPENLLSIIAWKEASGIDVIKLNTDLVYASLGGSELDQNYRWVNFCRGNAQGTKFAVYIRRVEGLTDPNGHYPNTAIFGYCTGGPPITVNKTYIFPDRANNWLLTQRDEIQELLTSFPAATEISYSTRTWSRSFLQWIVDAINDETKRYMLQDFIITRTVIHELGHACTIPHHGGGVSGSEHTGDLNCPIRGREDIQHTSEVFLFIMLDIIDQMGPGGEMPVTVYRNWKFCHSPDDCWSKININDRMP